MSKIVLDASAILAILNREPGADKLTVEPAERGGKQRGQSGRSSNYPRYAGWHSRRRLGRRLQPVAQGRSIYPGTGQDRGEPGCADAGSRLVSWRSCVPGAGNSARRAGLHHRSRLEEAKGRDRSAFAALVAMRRCNHSYSSLPAARSRISPRSAARNSYCGNSSSRTQRTW